MKWFFIFLFSLLMTACVTTGTDINSQVVTKYVVVEVDEDAVKTVSVPTPPDKKVYLALSPKERETVLTEYIVDLLKSLSMANVKLQSIKEMQEKVKQYYYFKEHPDERR